MRAIGMAFAQIFVDADRASQPLEQTLLQAVVVGIGVVNVRPAMAERRHKPGHALRICILDSSAQSSSVQHVHLVVSERAHDVLNCVEVVHKVVDDQKGTWSPRTERRRWPSKSLMKLLSSSRS